MMTVEDKKDLIRTFAGPLDSGGLAPVAISQLSWRDVFIPTFS